MYAADLHIHSKYSRATSADCVPAMLEKWAVRKGIGLLGTGDFTHPAWRQMLRDQLTEAEEGLYRLRDDCAAADPFAPPGAQRPRFVVSGEISSIYKQGGRVRKVHNLILLPSLDAAEALSKKLEAIGNIHSDGRPILGLSSHDLLDVTLNVCPEAIFIPAHIWTPHFSLFGAFSGFDTIEECFSDLTPHIHALETGLSSDPSMNWRLSALDRYTLISNSDAHSPAKLGRELNLIGAPLSFPSLKAAVEQGIPGGFLGTAEFFPEEGKYHFDGHRSCGVCLDPAEAAALDNLCPVCGKRLTTGVYHRVMQLADRPENCPPPANAAPFERLVPLAEIIAAVSGSSSASLKTQSRYEALIHALGSELTILRDLPIEAIERAAGKAVAEGVRRMRAGQIILSPGFDGEYGKVQLMTEDEIHALTGQMTFLDSLLPAAPKKSARKEAAPEAPSPAVLSAPAASAGLNAEQRAAVEAEEKCVAVVAGPGSGKTKTLVARIAHLIETGVKPSEIAAVTFTNKAAREMRERLTQRFGSRRAIQGMTIGTFHSISLVLLRRSRPGLTVLDEAGALSVASDLTGGLALNMSPARLLHEIEALRAGTPSDLDPEILSLFLQRLIALNADTFDGLLMEALADPLPPAFSHLLVDEYQDVNGIQRALVRKWSESGQSLFVIGDADQSIYGFRGADAACFDRLLADRPDARLVTLRKNYRSAPEILACAVPLIEKNGGKRLIEPGREPGGRVRRLCVPDEHAEAIAIAKEIGRMVGGMDMIEAHSGGEAARSVGFSDIAVLYRTHRQAELIEKCLSVEGVPYTVSGREEYLAAPEAAEAVAFLRLVLNPWDQAALCTLLPKRRLTLPVDADFSALCEALEQQGEPLAQTLRDCAPKGAKEKPRKLLERWQKKRAAAPTEAFTQLMNAASASADLSEFLSNLTLGDEGDVTRSGGKTYSPDSVRLMTLHGSKGLEFPVVFLAGLKRGVLPLETPYGRKTDLSEERRLLYVGMTRAKDELVLLSHPDESPFLREIPSDCLQTEAAAYQRKADAGKQLSFL